MRQIDIKTDFCIVGGGIAGICAAIAAARHGARVVLVQDRPILGGNASSEIRVHITGASFHGARKNARETGILEELLLENVRRNPQRSFSIWDMVLYDKVKAEKNIRLLLNTTVLDATVEPDRIVSVKGWQLTSETWYTIETRLFADCSGDSILAPLTGALFRKGREARNEFDESIAPEVADDLTMGMTCLFAAKDVGHPVKYEPPAWAYDFPTDEAVGRAGHDWLEMGYWWIELGGNRDSISDTEEIRDELLRIVFGLWDHIKNHGDHSADNWVLDWVQFLPGKRESRRFIGDHVLTQGDIESGGAFVDTVAYGGWSMDLHPPDGFFAKTPPCVHHHVEDVYGIPFRCLYSKNISNLFFAGRNISATHVGIGSTRVMGTCGVLGQAVGTAAAMAISYGLNPREISQQKTDELQQRLLSDDCYLPRFRQRYGELTSSGRMSSNCDNVEKVRDGVTRSVKNEDHCWEGGVGDWIQYSWDTPKTISGVRLTFDSNLNREIALTHHGRYGYDVPTSPPEELISDFHIETRQGDTWQTVTEVQGNYQRFVSLSIACQANAIRLLVDSTHGVKRARVFRFEVI